jgi:chemotaxis protein MotB
MSAKSGGHAKSGKGHARRGHEEEHEEHVNHERWLVTYADMLTLLFVLFVVLFAMSQVDQKKFAELKTGLSSGFGAKVSMMSGANNLLSMGSSVAPAMNSITGKSDASDSTSKTGTDSSSAPDPKKVAALVKELEKAAVSQEASKLAKAEKALKTALQKSGQSKAVNFGYTPEGLDMTITTDKVLFANGSATLQPQGRKILKALCSTLDGLPNDLSINGHTNSVPIHTAQFPSNWELSSGRANGVLSFLQSTCGIDSGRLRSVGFSDTRPLVTPADSSQALARNRRVEIIIMAKLDNSQGRALQQVGNDAETTGASTSDAQGLLAPDGAGTTSSGSTPGSSP